MYVQQEREQASALSRRCPLRCRDRTGWAWWGSAWVCSAVSRRHLVSSAADTPTMRLSLAVMECARCLRGLVITDLHTITPSFTTETDVHIHQKPSLNRLIQGHDMLTSGHDVITRQLALICICIRLGQMDFHDMTKHFRYKIVSLNIHTSLIHLASNI